MWKGRTIYAAMRSLEKIRIKIFGIHFLISFFLASHHFSKKLRTACISFLPPLLHYATGISCDHILIDSKRSVFSDFFPKKCTSTPKNVIDRDFSGCRIYTKVVNPIYILFACSCDGSYYHWPLCLTSLTWSFLISP